MKRGIVACSMAIVLAAALTAAVATRVAAQGVDTLRAGYYIVQPQSLAFSVTSGWVMPGITVSTPAAYGADWGDAFVGVGLQSRTRARDAIDGGAVVGFGIGDARELLGAEIAITSYGTARSCCRGGVSVKLHRALPANSAVAVGVENALTWGHMQGLEEATDAGTSVYAVASTALVLNDASSLFSMLTLSAGAGNGRFREEGDIIAGRVAVNAFGSASLRVIEPLAAIVNWTGQDLVAGVSVVPFRNVPLFITPAAADLTTDPRFILGIGFGFDYGSWF